MQTPWLPNNIRIFLHNLSDTKTIQHFTLIITPLQKKTKRQTNAKNELFSHSFVHGVHDSYLMAFVQNKTTIIFCMTPRFAYNSALGDMNGHSDMLLRATARVGLDYNTFVHGKHNNSTQKWECSLHKDWSLSWRTLFEVYLKDTWEETSM